MIALAALLVVVLAGGALWRSIRPLVERRLAVLERRIALDEAARGLGAVPDATPAEKMPSDLLLYTVSPAEEWARDEATSYVWQLYQQHGDWATVRNIVNAEEATRREQAEHELASIATRGGLLS